LKKCIFLLCVAAVLAAGACQPPLDIIDLGGDKWWAVDFTKTSKQQGYFYQVSSNLLYVGEKCLIYVESGSAVSEADAREFASEYDGTIHGLMLEYFSEREFEVDQITYAETLEYAYNLVGDQDKLIILLLDIKDGYKGRPGDGYVAGYFDPTNFYYGNNSNYKSMIYVDTNPGMRNKEEMFSTFTHELQHLINYVTSIRIRPNGQNPYPYQMDTWIDEGLSLMAERLYQGHLESRIAWFNEDRAGTIARGNNFYVWDNYENYPNAVLDEYATAYLFFQWLYLQADENPALLKGIATSDKHDYHALTENTASVIPNGGDWETLLRTWMAANYINNSTGVYGYKGKSAFATININAYPNTGNTIELFPGEGVYSAIASSFTPSVGSGANVRYAGLQKGSAVNVNASGPSYTGAYLLTFNINTTNSKEIMQREKGYVTGVSAIPFGAVAASRSVENFSYPIRIDARDLMRRNNESPQIMGSPVNGKAIAK